MHKVFQGYGQHSDASLWARLGKIVGVVRYAVRDVFAEIPLHVQLLMVGTSAFQESPAARYMESSERAMILRHERIKRYTCSPASLVMRRRATYHRRLCGCAWCCASQYGLAPAA